MDCYLRAALAAKNEKLLITLAWTPVNEDIRNAGILESRRTQDEITFNTTFSSCFLCFWMIEIELNQLECESEFKLDTVRRKR